MNIRIIKYKHKIRIGLRGFKHSLPFVMYIYLLDDNLEVHARNPQGDTKHPLSHYMLQNIAE